MKAWLLLQAVIGIILCYIFWKQEQQTDTRNVLRLLSELPGEECPQNFTLYHLQDEEGQHVYSIQTETDSRGHLNWRRCERRETHEIQQQAKTGLSLGNVVKLNHTQSSVVSKACHDEGYDMRPLLRRQTDDQDNRKRVVPDVFLRNIGKSESKLDGDRQEAIKTLMNGIFPGTKWCGFGNIAEDVYSELGEHAGTDACCRAHDLCRPVVHPYTTRYGRRHTSPITLGHCSCDTRLFNCLKAVNSTVSMRVGQLFFNLAMVDCFDFETREICIGSLLNICYQSTRKCVASIKENPPFL